MLKIDHRKELKTLYVPPAHQITRVDVPEFSYLSLDGEGHPQSQGFQQAAGTLYPLAYTLKFMVRERLEIDYHVMPMEVTWVVDREHKGNFSWTMSLWQPQWVDEALVSEARERVRAKGLAPLLNQVRFERSCEGACVQTLHTGPYEGMNDTLARMQAWAGEQHYVTARDTHDIYLNDMRKTRPENLKAVMRVQIIQG